MWLPNANINASMSGIWYTPNIDYQKLDSVQKLSTVKYNFIRSSNKLIFDDRRLWRSLLLAVRCAYSRSEVIEFLWTNPLKINILLNFCLPFFFFFTYLVMRHVLHTIVAAFFLLDFFIFQITLNEISEKIRRVTVCWWLIFLSRAFCFQFVYLVFKYFKFNLWPKISVQIMRDRFIPLGIRYCNIRYTVIPISKYT